SDRHPVFATSLIKHLDQGAPPPKGHAALRSTVRALGTHRRLDQMENQYPRLSASATRPNPPDVLVVIVESLRPDAIDAHSTPHLHRLASRGLRATNHFSSSNA